MADIRAGLPAGVHLRRPERGRDHNPSVDEPNASPHTTHRPARAAPVLGIAPTTAVWTGNCSMPVELARLVGPLAGVIETPAHLIEHVPAETSWDLGQDAVKIRLYELCLTYGGCFEIYRCVNLAELAWLWSRLSLPAGIWAQWTAALREEGLLPATVASGSGLPLGRVVTAQPLITESAAR